MLHKHIIIINVWTQSCWGLQNRIIMDKSAEKRDKTNTKETNQRKKHRKNINTKNETK